MILLIYFFVTMIRDVFFYIYYTIQYTMIECCPTPSLLNEEHTQFETFFFSFFDQTLCLSLVPWNRQIVVPPRENVFGQYNTSIHISLNVALFSIINWHMHPVRDYQIDHCDITKYRSMHYPQR